VLDARSSANALLDQTELLMKLSANRFAVAQGRSPERPREVQHKGLVTSSHHMSTGINKSNIARDVACAVA